MATTITAYTFKELSDDVKMDVIKSYKNYIVETVKENLRENWDELIRKTEDHLSDMFPEKSTEMEYTDTYVASKCTLSVFPSEMFDYSPYEVENILSRLYSLSLRFGLLIGDYIKNAELNYKGAPLPIVLKNILQSAADSASTFLNRIRTSDKFIKDYIDGYSKYFTERNMFYKWKFTENGDVISRPEWAKE